MYMILGLVLCVLSLAWIIFNFFVKDPDEKYETYDFELKGDRVVFNPGAADISPEAKPDTEAFCERCFWHDKFQQLKNS